MATIFRPAAGLLFLLAWLLPAASWGATAPDLSGFAYQPHPGAALPLDALFRDDDGRQVALGDLIAGQPTVLALVYFHCPNLCGVVQADLLHALAGSGLATPDDYRLIALSIDPSETAADAAAARASDLAQFPTTGAERGWHFLTGGQAAIQQVADAVGFKDRFDPARKQFIHPAGIVFVTAAGTVSDYLLGVGFTAGDVRAGVLRAGRNTIARSVLPVLLLCFHFDPLTGRYSLAVMRLLQIAAALFVLTLSGTLWLSLRRRRA